MDDKQIIDMFFRRDEQAIRECMETYGAYCRSIAAGILSDPADAEETVADTWLAAWDSIPPTRPQNLRLYLARLTRNRSIDIWRKGQTQTRGGGQIPQVLEELSECVGPQSDPEQQLNAKELSNAVTAFLKTEPTMRRSVFLRRYFYLEDLPDIARRYQLRESNVRMMLCRTRQKLRKFLIQEGYIQ